MNIIETNLKFTNELDIRKKTDYIILHHSTANISVESVHISHLNQGWCGIGYHFYIRKNGTIYRGRPMNTIGAHAVGYNSVSIGVCFEGNFENETMCDAQIKAGQELVLYLKNIYPSSAVLKHSNVTATACPGINFPFDKISKGVTDMELVSINDIVWELTNRGIISDKDLWLMKLKTDEDVYWLARKCANYIMNQK